MTAMNDLLRKVDLRVAPLGEDLQLPKGKKVKKLKKVYKSPAEEKKIAEANRQMRIREAQKTARGWDIEKSDGGRWSGREERKGDPGNRASRTVEDLNKWYEKYWRSF